jgi:hypothetical protein
MCANLSPLFSFTQLNQLTLNATDAVIVFHIVNPHLVWWKGVLDAMRSSGMHFDKVTPMAWVETLSKDDTNPAFRLMSFYQDHFKQLLNMPVWKTEKTMGVTPIIGESPVLDAALFSKFLGRWASVGFYQVDSNYCLK